MLEMMAFAREDGEMFHEIMARFNMVREDAENEAGFFSAATAYSLIIIRNYPLELKVQ